MRGRELLAFGRIPPTKSSSTEPVGGSVSTQGIRPPPWPLPPTALQRPLQGPASLALPGPPSGARGPRPQRAHSPPLSCLCIEARAPVAEDLGEAGFYLRAERWREKPLGARRWAKPRRAGGLWHLRSARRFPLGPCRFSYYFLVSYSRTILCFPLL